MQHESETKILIRRKPEGRAGSYRVWISTNVRGLTGQVVVWHNLRLGVLFAARKSRSGPQVESVRPASKFYDQTCGGS